MAQTLNAEKQTAQEQSVGRGNQQASLGSRACLHGTGLRRIRPRGLRRRAAHSVQGSLSARPADSELAGALGSYALIGVLVGALIAGTLSDKSGDGRWS